MSLRLSPEERYAKIREGVVALALVKDRGAGLLREGFFESGAQGHDALEHLRDVLHDLAEQHGVEALFCIYCGGLVIGDGSPEEIEEEAHRGCAASE